MTGEQGTLRKFYDLLAIAHRVDASLEDAEDEFSAVLDYVLAHPEIRPALAKVFVALARDPDKAPPELVAFCITSFTGRR